MTMILWSVTPGFRCSPRTNVSAQRISSVPVELIIVQPPVQLEKSDLLEMSNALIPKEETLTMERRLSDFDNYYYGVVVGERELRRALGGQRCGGGDHSNGVGDGVGMSVLNSDG